MNHNKYSTHKIAWFPEKLWSFRTGRITAPVYVRVKPTNRCNHDCFFCVYKKSFSGMHDRSTDRETGFEGKPSQLSRDKLLELMDDFWEIGVKAVTFSGGGEPLLHPDIVEVMDRTIKNGLDLSIITNGQLLSGKRAERLAAACWVRVSIDYNSAEEMARTRNVHPRMFDEVYRNLKNFAAFKPACCDLTCNFIVHAENWQGLVETTKRLRDHGVENVRFSPMWIPDFHAYHSRIKVAVEEKIEEAMQLSGERFTVSSSYHLLASANNLHRGYPRCWFMQVVPVVGADGFIYACHNKAYDSSGMIGSINGQRFKEAWFSDEAREKFGSLNPNEVCCHQCANDGKNLLMNAIMDASTDNFI